MDPKQYLSTSVALAKTTKHLDLDFQTSVARCTHDTLGMEIL